MTDPTDHREHDMIDTLYRLTVATIITALAITINMFTAPGDPASTYITDCLSAHC